MYQFNLTPYEFDMSHQEGTTKNAVLHKTAKMELSAFAPELFNCNHIMYLCVCIIMFCIYKYAYLSTYTL